RIVSMHLPVVPLATSIIPCAPLEVDPDVLVLHCTHPASPIHIGRNRPEDQATGFEWRFEARTKVIHLVGMNARSLGRHFSCSPCHHFACCPMCIYRLVQSQDVSHKMTAMRFVFPLISCLTIFAGTNLGNMLFYISV